MSRRVRSAVFALLCASVSSLVVLVGYGGTGAMRTFALLAPVGVVTVLATEAAVARRRRLGGLPRQAGTVAGLAAAGAAVTVASFVALMYVSTHDAVLTALVVADAAALTAWSLRMLGAEVMDDLDAVRGTLGAVAEGRRDRRTGVRGHDEVAGLAAAVDGAVARLDAEERARRGLVGAISHDLRTPLTALRLLAEAIDDELVDADTRREYAARMATHVRALGSLIDDLFELTRLEAGELAWSMEQVRLDLLVRESVDALRPTADAAGVHVDAPDGTSELTARADPDGVQRVLFNLVTNAIRHTPADGSVTVHVEQVGDGVEVEVADTGEGIDAAHRDRVFEPFFRGDGARREAGAGLGLAIARAIVEGHGGRIWLPEAERGTRVRFSLPG